MPLIVVRSNLVLIIMKCPLLIKLTRKIVTATVTAAVTLVTYIIAPVVTIITTTTITATTANGGITIIKYIIALITTTIITITYTKVTFFSTGKIYAYEYNAVFISLLPVLIPVFPSFQVCIGEVRECQGVCGMDCEKSRA